MNAAGVGLALNALTSRYKARDADATTAMTKEGWARMAEGVSRAFGAEGDDGGDDRLGSAAAAGGAGGETSAGGFEKGHAEIDVDVRGRVAERGASSRAAPADVAMAVDAAKKFPDFAAALDAETKKTTPGGDEKTTKSSRRTPPGQQPLLRGWDALAARVVSTIPWDPVHVTIFSSALGWLPALAEALARRPGGSRASSRASSVGGRTACPESTRMRRRGGAESRQVDGENRRGGEADEGTRRVPNVRRGGRPSEAGGVREWDRARAGERQEQAAARRGAR